MGEPVESQTTFSALCLTSKPFLPLAREYLYYRPLRLQNFQSSGNNDLGGRILTDSLVHKALCHPLFQNIKQLKLIEIEIATTVPLPSPTIVLPLTSLNIHEDYAHLESVKQFFMASSVSLVEFVIHLVDLTSSDVDWILKALPVTLKKLLISHHAGFERTRGRPSLTKYAQKRKHSLPNIPLDPISRFTSLHTLKLAGLQGSIPRSSSPSLDHFSIVIENRLCQLLLDRRQASSRTERDGLEGDSFPRRKIQKVREALQRLDLIHFGWLPTRDRNYYQELMTNLENRGVTVEWVECRPSKVQRG